MPPKRKVADEATSGNGSEAQQEPKAKKTKADKNASNEKKKKAAADVPEVTSMDFSNTSKTKDGRAWNMKFSSWNVNGIRAWLDKNGHAYVGAENPDIFCVQETKCSRELIPEAANVPGYHTFWLSADKDGYAGTGLYSKVKPLNVTYGMGIDKHDTEGRLITAEYEKFYFITSYVPNSGRGLPRLGYRTKEWDVDLRKYLMDLDKKKPIVFCGDLNVAHKEIGTYYTKLWCRLLYH